MDVTWMEIPRQAPSPNRCLIPLSVPLVGAWPDGWRRLAGHRRSWRDGRRSLAGVQNGVADDLLAVVPDDDVVVRKVRIGSRSRRAKTHVKDVPIDVVRRIQGLGSLTHQGEQLDVFKRFDQGHR